MKNKHLESLDSEQFRRLTGVKQDIFEKMLIVLKESDIAKKSKGGRKNKLCLEEQLLLALEYLR